MFVFAILYVIVLEKNCLNIDSTNLVHKVIQSVNFCKLHKVSYLVNEIFQLGFDIEFFF